MKIGLVKKTLYVKNELNLSSYAKKGKLKNATGASTLKLFLLTQVD